LNIYWKCDVVTRSNANDMHLNGNPKAASQKLHFKVQSMTVLACQ